MQVFYDGFARENPALSLQEHFENREFVGGQIDGLSAYFHFVEFGVQLNSVARKNCSGIFGCGGGVAQLRPDSRQQHARAERLCDVVVRAIVEPAHDVRLLASRGQHYYRDLRIAFVCAVDFAKFRPVHSREHQVEQNQVETRAVVEHFQRLFSGVGTRALVAVLCEIELYELADALLIFDYQNVFACHGCYPIVIENSEPFPSSLLAPTLPLCSSATCFTIASPSPVPPCARERPLSTR